MTQPVAIIVGGGPGISASCARLFSREGMKVAVAARNPEKPVLDELAQEHGVLCLPCDATNPAAVKTLFSEVKASLGNPSLVIHNIDGRHSTPCSCASLSSTGFSGLRAATATFMPSRVNNRAQLALIPGPPPTIIATGCVLFLCFLF